MILSKSDLTEYINADNHWLLPTTRKEKIVEYAAAYPSRILRKYLRYLRKQEYYLNTANGSNLKGINLGH